MKRILGPSRALALALGVSFALAGCGGGLSNDGSATVNWERTHKIDVVGRYVTTPIDVPANAGALAPTEIAKLDRLVADFIRAGGKGIEIAVPRGTAGKGPARARANLVREHILRRQALPGEIQTRFSDVAGDGPVVVSYERFTATPPKCRPITENMAYNPRNLGAESFGCAQQHNISVMISNPADLVRMQEESPVDGARRTLPISRYRNPSE